MTKASVISNNSLMYVDRFCLIDFVCEFGGEGKGSLWRVENIGENDKKIRIF